MIVCGRLISQGSDRKTVKIAWERSVDNERFINSGVLETPDQPAFGIFFHRSGQMRSLASSAVLVKSNSVHYCPLHRQ